MKTRQLNWVLWVGVMAIVLGTFLPWAKVVSPFGTVSANGLDSVDGKLVLAGGLALAALLYRNSLVPGKGTWVPGVLLAVTAAGVGLYDANRVADLRIAQVGAGLTFSAQVGSGLYLIVLGGLAVFAGLMLQAAGKDKDVEQAKTPPRPQAPPMPQPQAPPQASPLFSRPVPLAVLAAHPSAQSQPQPQREPEVQPQVQPQPESVPQPQPEPQPEPVAITASPADDETPAEAPAPPAQARVGVSFERWAEFERTKI